MEKTHRAGGRCNRDIEIEQDQPNQVGEWTDNPKMQVKGAAKQAEGKVQNAFGQAKDTAKQAADDVRAGSKAPQRVPDQTDAEEAESKDARRRG